jgi:hypothetical protein
MDVTQDAEAQGNEGTNRLFVPGSDRYNRPGRIVTLGHFYPEREAETARDRLREPRGDYNAGAPADRSMMGRNLGWTRMITALNAERQWALKRFTALLDPLLEPGIALCVVPTHLGYQAFWPTRTLAQQLAANGRIDATACLVRHTTIRRITFGGPSTRALHRETIRVEYPERVAGQRVLLLDDVAKSGASLLACQELLYEAGATLVQAMALGKVILKIVPPSA